VSSRPGRRKLLTVLGVGFGLAVTLGNMIGAGILRTPGEIAARLPTFALFLSVWIVGGLYALLGANALAELATLVPESGGQYVFVRRGLGDYAAFIVGWSDWISTCGTTAAVAYVIGEYAIVPLPWLKSAEVVALVVVALFTILQWRGTRWGGMAQDVTSLLKALVFIVLIGACFRLGGRNPAAIALVPDAEGSLVLAYILALQAVIYTYDGWTAVVYFSEEVKEGGKNIPRSMFGGVVAVMAIYILVNVAFLRVVPLATIAGQAFPAGVVAQHLFGRVFHQPRLPRIRQRLRYRLDQTKSLLDLSQQQETTIGRNIAAIKPDINFAAAELGKGHLSRGTIRHRRNLHVG